MIGLVVGILDFLTLLFLKVCVNLHKVEYFWAVVVVDLDANRKSCKSVIDCLVFG